MHAYLTAAYDAASIMNYCDASGNLTTSLSAGDIAGAQRSDAYGAPFIVPSPQTVTVTAGDTNGTELVVVTGNQWAGPQGINGQVYPIGISFAALPVGMEAIPLYTSGTAIHMKLVAAAGAPRGSSVATILGRGSDALGNVETHSALVGITVASSTACQPTVTCATYQVDPGLYGAECGNPPDGCGGFLSCGTCSGTDTCSHYTCVSAGPPLCKPSDCVCAPGPWKGIASIISSRT